jgi:uncharacterized spore protein YtfJ
MNYQDLLDRLGALKDTATVSRVFGEPLQVGEKTIIPVAEVRTGMGFGFGTNSEAGEAEEEESNEGGGGGGGVNVRPAGVLEITPEATTFIPTPTGVSPVLLVAVGFGLGLLWAGRRRRGD